MYLNVYDLIPPHVNRPLTAAGVGVFHCGVEIDGKEWSFGLAPDEHTLTGVFCVDPLQSLPSVRAHIFLGTSNISPEQLTTLIQRLTIEWPASEYHVLGNNCNRFCEVLCQHLTTHVPLIVPTWVNRVSNVANTVVPRRLATYVMGKLDDGSAQLAASPARDTKSRLVIPNAANTGGSKPPQAASNPSSSSIGKAPSTALRPAPPETASASVASVATVIPKPGTSTIRMNNDRPAIIVNVQSSPVKRVDPMANVNSHQPPAPRATEHSSAAVIATTEGSESHFELDGVASAFPLPVTPPPCDPSVLEFGMDDGAAEEGGGDGGGPIRVHKVAVIFESSASRAMSVSASKSVDSVDSTTDDAKQTPGNMDVMIISPSTATAAKSSSSGGREVTLSPSSASYNAEAMSEMGDKEEEEASVEFGDDPSLTRPAHQPIAAAGPHCGPSCSSTNAAAAGPASALRTAVPPSRESHGGVPCGAAVSSPPKVVRPHVVAGVRMVPTAPGGGAGLLRGDAVVVAAAASRGTDASMSPSTEGGGSSAVNDGDDDEDGGADSTDTGTVTVAGLRPGAAADHAAADNLTTLRDDPASASLRGVGGGPGGGGGGTTLMAPPTTERQPSHTADDEGRETRSLLEPHSATAGSGGEAMRLRERPNFSPDLSEALDPDDTR